MPLDKTILKAIPQQAAVVVSGASDFVTITPQDLLFYNQNVVDPANVNIAVTALHYQISQSGSIARNGAIILNLVSGSGTVRFAEEFGCTLGMNANSNITVTFGTGNSSVVMMLSKTAGYALPDRQIMQPWER